jgi:hypothetical protein
VEDRSRLGHVSVSSMHQIPKCWTIESLELSTVPWVPAPTRRRGEFVQRDLAVKPDDLAWIWEVIRPRTIFPSSRRLRLCLGMGTLAVLGLRSFLRARGGRPETGV